LYGFSNTASAPAAFARAVFVDDRHFVATSPDFFEKIEAAPSQHVGIPVDLGQCPTEESGRRWE